MYNNALVVGRFQSVNLDKEIEFIKQLKHDKVLVAIVTPQSQFTKINPFDFHVISQTILGKLLGKATCVEMKTKRYPDAWTKQIDDLALDTRSFNIYIMGEFPDYMGTYHVVKVGDDSEILSNPYQYDGPITREFRAGIAYAVSRQFDKVYNTVDIAGFWEGNLLLGRKKHEKLWRFVGGFVDPEDESMERAAQREFLEEAGSPLLDPQYVCSMRVDDWRYKKGKDKIITTLFTGKIDMITPPHAGDDINEIKMFDFFQEIAMNPGGWKNLIVPEHIPLMGSLVRRIARK